MTLDSDPATPFADLLPAAEQGTLVRARVEVLPGDVHGPAGMATYEGVVVEVLTDSGSPGGPGRYFRSLRLRNGPKDEEYRFDYRGGVRASAWFRRAAGEDPFDDSDLWGRRRRVYAFEVEGQGLTARRERAGNSFISVQGPQDHE